MTDSSEFLTIDDLYQLGWLEEPAWSPDSRQIAYVRVTVDKPSNTYRRSIWLASRDGGPQRRLTSGVRSDTTPRWSPDGRQIAFVSNRDGEVGQIYTIHVDGGEARRITKARWGASDPAWSPDGKRLAFLSRLNAEERAAEDEGKPEPEPEDIWERNQAKARKAHDEQERLDPRVITRLPYRGGTTFFDDRRNQVYVIDLPADDESEPGTQRRLTDTDVHHSAPVWMPDGGSILTTATRDPEADSLFSYYNVLRVPVPESGRAAPVSLTTTGYSYFDPRPSPDGRLIAFRRRPDLRPLAVGSRIALIPADGGELQDLTAGIDLNIEQFCWSPDGASILFTAGWRGAEPIYQVRVGGGQQAQAQPEHHQPPIPPLVTAEYSRIVSEFDVAADGSIALVAGSAANPCELFLWQPGSSETQLTFINRNILSTKKIAAVEEITYTAPDGGDVQGWVLRPPDFDPAKTYPLAIHIHGGPHVMWGPGFRSMWHELQVNAAHGYITFFCNPRGSEGYGEAWRDAIHAGWGLRDEQDFHAGIDAVIARGNVDQARIAVTGGSYGGFMTTWLISHSNRFVCAVAARGVYDLLSFHGTSDAHELIEHEFDGFPWTERDLLWEHSPLTHAGNITTPLLILHSEQDYRVPISQAEQLFSALRRRKQTVELVRYPREGHELTRSGEPRHRADHMRRTLAWFDRYCSNENS